MNRKFVITMLVVGLCMGSFANGVKIMKVEASTPRVSGVKASVLNDTLSAVTEQAEEQRQYEVRRNNYIAPTSIIKDIINVETILLTEGVLKTYEIPADEEEEETQEAPKLGSTKGLTGVTPWDGDESDVAWSDIFSCTAYCNCYACSGEYSPDVGGKGTTFSGKYPQQGRTIAVDKNLIPIGTRVVINGYVYIAEDIGGAVKGNTIDIYFSSHSDVNKWGRRNLKVKILKSKKGKKKK